MPRLVCLSDTHGSHEDVVVPDGDVLLFAGDACNVGTPNEWRSFCDWLSRLPHPTKLVVPGNHDAVVQPAVPAWGVAAPYDARDRAEALLRLALAGAHLLDRESLTAAGLAIWGAPWVPAFHDWAFNLPRNGEALDAVWAAIPSDLDVLITHTPPHGTLDRTSGGDHAGCERLAERLATLDARGRGPRLHVFGDIHEAAGVRAPPAGVTGRIAINASVLDGTGVVAHAPTVLTLDPR